MNNLYEIQYLDIKPDEKYDEIISKVVKECFRVENLLDSKLYISITLTTPENIQKYNKQYRNLDKPTDVLSFPMIEYEFPEDFSRLEDESVDCFNQDNGELFFQDLTNAVFYRVLNDEIVDLNITCLSDTICTTATLLDLHRVPR